MPRCASDRESAVGLERVGDDGRMRSRARVSRWTSGNAHGTTLGVRSRLRDWVLSTLVVLAHLAPVQAGRPDTDTASWVEGVAPVPLALGSGLALLGRHRDPRLVAGVVLACYAGLALVQGPVPPYAAWILIWSLAVSGDGRRRSVVRASVAAAAVSLLVITADLARAGDGAFALLVAITVLVLLAAVLVRSERGRVEAVGRRAGTEERLRIARDLHDLVGHGLSTIAVQSSTARLALQSGDGIAAGTALTAVESTSRIALREMRQMLGVLTDAEGDVGSPDGPGRPEGVPRPAPGLDDLGPLLDNVRAAGVAVALEQAGDWGSASPGVQLVIYRIVQEGLTNALKHAPGSLVSVRLDASDESAKVSVETVGTTAVTGRLSSTPGLGLDGLRTRVTAVAGEFAYGPTDHGWIIEARVPLHEEGKR